MFRAMHVTGRGSGARAALLAGTALAATALMVSGALGDGDGPFRPHPDAQWTTVLKPASGIEGLTTDARGNLYTPARATNAPCPVYRGSIRGGAPVVVGTLPAPCSPAGLTFGRDGRLYVTDNDRIDVLTPDARTPPTATVFATGVPGANGVAFDRRGTLWVSDGGTAQGRVWTVSPAGAVTEAFRVPTGTNAAGVGSSRNSTPPGTPQAIVANGLAFGRDGTLYVADTARGAIWRVRLSGDGRVLSRTGCDSTYPADALCLDDVFVQHPALEGADGIVMDGHDDIVVAANERNAIAVVTERGDVVELFRNPVAASGLRDEGPLEFPTSPVLVGDTVCVTNSDGARRDNAPNTPGEGPKVSCMR